MRHFGIRASSRMVKIWRGGVREGELDRRTDEIYGRYAKFLPEWFSSRLVKPVQPLESRPECSLQGPGYSKSLRMADLGEEEGRKELWFCMGWSMERLAFLSSHYNTPRF